MPPTDGGNLRVMSRQGTFVSVSAENDFDLSLKELKAEEGRPVEEDLPPRTGGSGGPAFLGRPGRSQPERLYGPKPDVNDERFRVGLGSSPGSPSTRRPLELIGISPTCQFSGGPSGFQGSPSLGVLSPERSHSSPD